MISLPVDRFIAQLNRAPAVQGAMRRMGSKYQDLF
jgi:hypothetical protein